MDKKVILTVTVAVVVIVLMTTALIIFVHEIYQWGTYRQTQSSFKEPTPLMTQINFTQNIIDDLHRLECNLYRFECTTIYSPHPFGEIWTNYTEFRRVAYKTKVVFYCISEGIPNNLVTLVTIFNGYRMCTSLSVFNGGN